MNTIGKLVANNLGEYKSAIDRLSARQAIDLGSQVSKIRRLDEAFLKVAIQLLIEDVLLSFGQLDKVSQSEVKRATEQIAGSYWWMKIEEIAYVFNKGKSLEYGKVFGNVSLSVLFDWISQYDLGERQEEIYHVNKELQEAGNSSNKLSQEDLEKLYKNVGIIEEENSLPDSSIRWNDRKKEKDIEYLKFKTEYLKK